MQTQRCGQRNMWCSRCRRVPMAPLGMLLGDSDVPKHVMMRSKLCSSADDGTTRNTHTTGLVVTTKRRAFLRTTSATRTACDGSDAGVQRRVTGVQTASVCRRLDVLFHRQQTCCEGGQDYSNGALRHTARQSMTTGQMGNSADEWMRIVQRGNARLRWETHTHPASPRHTPAQRHTGLPPKTST